MSRTDKDRPSTLQFDDPMAGSRLATAPWHTHVRYDFATRRIIFMGCDFGHRNNIDDFKRKHDGDHAPHHCSLTSLVADDKPLKRDRRAVERSYRRNTATMLHDAKRRGYDPDIDVPSVRVARAARAATYL